MQLKGQLSIETMIVLAIIFALFVSVNIVLGIRGNELTNLETNLQDKLLCDKLSAVINSVQSNPGTEARITLNKEVLVLNGEISVGEWICLFFGQSEDKNLSATTIKIYEEGGLVKFEEVS